MMLSAFVPLSSFHPSVKNSTIPSSSIAGPVQHRGRAKLILTEWILQATTPNQWQAAEQKAWDRRWGQYLLSLIYSHKDKIKIVKYLIYTLDHPTTIKICFWTNSLWKSKKEVQKSALHFKTQIIIGTCDHYHASGK